MKLLEEKVTRRNAIQRYARHNNNVKTLKYFTWPLTISAIFFLLICPAQTDDLWMYLTLGRRLFTLGEFGETDPYLFTFPNYHWHVWHEWLSYVIYYSLYMATGFRGLIVLKALLASIAAGLVWKAGARFKLPPLVLLLIGSASLYVASARCCADRSSFFSDLITVAFLFFLTDKKFKANDVKIRWALPAIFLVWVQLHPGFLIGWFMLGLFTICNIRTWDYLERRNWLIIMGLCVVITVINPVGIDGIFFPINAFLSPDWKIFREINSEWMNTFTAWYITLPYKIFCVVFMAATLAVTGAISRRGTWFPFLASLVLCYLGLSAVRFLALSGFGLGVLLSTSLGMYLENMNWTPARGRVATVIAFIIPLACIFISLSTDTFGIRLLLSDDPVSDAIPIKAARLFKQLPPGNIFNEYHFGGLLAWELDGRMKFAAHGHLDKPALVVQNYFRFTYSRANWDDIIVKGDVEYFFFSQSSISTNSHGAWVKELMGPNWRPIYEDEAAVIFKRQR